MMKRFIYIIILMISSLYAAGQDSVSLQSASIALPKTLKALSKTEASNFLNRHFRYKVNVSNDDKAYFKDGLLIKINDHRFSKSYSASLEKLEKQVANGSIGLNYHSEIKTINNNRYLIVETITDNEGNLDVFSDYINNANIHLYIKFKIEDKSKAYIALYELLNRIQFRRNFK